MKKITSRKDSEFFGDFIDFFMDLFEEIAEFIRHPKEKPSLRKKK